jgi:hypothetical protein
MVYVASRTLGYRKSVGGKQQDVSSNAWLTGPAFVMQSILLRHNKCFTMLYRELSVYTDQKLINTCA